jgi:integrase
VSRIDCQESITPAMARHLLTDVAVRNAKKKDAPYRLFDGDGLALWVSPTGVKSWQLRYRHDGKEQTATLGKLTRMSLAEARTAADEARKLAASGEHLTTAKRVAKAERKADAANTFGAFAAEWVQREAGRQGWSAGYVDEVTASIRNHLADLDRLPLKKITAAIAQPSLDRVEREAPRMIEKVRPRLRAILDDAVVRGLIPGNPIPATRRRKGSNGGKRHYPAITEPKALGAILRAARASDPCKGIQRAHALLAFTAQRVSEVVGATWAEFHLDAGIWAIPRARMKRKDAERGPHAIPLPPALLKSLAGWREADGKGAIFACPAPRDAERPITPEGVEKFYRDALGLGGKHSPHSWRAAFSTICRDAGKNGDVIEAQLDHVVGNKIAAAYDRAQRLDLRRTLLAWYEAQLLAARDAQ